VRGSRSRGWARLGLLSAAVALVAALSAGATQAKTDGASAAQGEAAPSGTVTLAGWTSTGVEGKLLRQVLAAFQRSHPRIKVNYTPIGGDYPAAMLAKFSARRPPDAFYVDSNVAPDWIFQRVLQPLDSYVKKSHFDTKKFFPSLLGAFRGKDGKLYGLPKDWSPLAMEINTAMLRKSGAKVPTTWAELTATARKLKSTNAVPGGAPLCLDPDWARMLAFVYQNKGTFLNKGKTAPTVQSAAVKGAVNYYVGLVKSGLAQTHDKLGVTWCGEALGKEKAAIIFEGNWVVPAMRDTFPDVRYSINPLPKGKQRGNLAFTVSYSMARDAKNKDAAWELIRYMTTDPHALAILSNGLRNVPTTIDSLKSTELAPDPQFKVFMDIFAHPQTATTPITAAGSANQELFQNMVVKHQAGKVPNLPAALATTDKQIDAQLAQSSGQQVP
jgi:multiple sugar transport system substrate-binding protein